VNNSLTIKYRFDYASTSLSNQLNDQILISDSLFMNGDLLYR